MRILCIFQFFATGATPDTVRPFRLCRLLAERGHDVTVLATDFNRHSGENEGERYEEVETSGRVLRIVRVPSARNYRKGLGQRFLNYAGFSVRVLLTGFGLSRGADLVLTSVPPTFVGPVGWFLAAVRRCPFLLEVRDLWPDALEVKGAVRNRILLRLLYAISNFQYRRASALVSITYGIKQELVRKGLEGSSIAVLPNGFDPELFEGGRSRMEVRRERGWGEDFVVIYIGTLVEVTAMDTVVAAAALLRDRPQIRFELFGAGNQEQPLQEMIEAQGLTNIRLNGTVAKTDVPSLLRAADACVMCLINTPLAHIYLQNKFFDYLGAARPVVAAMDGHQRMVIDQIGVGLCVAPGDAEGLAGAVRRLIDDPASARAMGQRGAEYAKQYFSLDEVLDRYVGIIELMTRQGSSLRCPETLPPLVTSETAASPGAARD